MGLRPGVGPLVTFAVLLPLTFGLPPEGGLIMLAGIYYGAAYGGSTTAILVNLPGESSAVVTCIDGYQMARKGRAGPALAIAAIGSRSEEHTSELQSLMRISYAVFCLKKKKTIRHYCLHYYFLGLLIHQQNYQSQSIHL